MSWMKREEKNKRAEEKLAAQDPVTNFMGGTSYRWNALDTLKMITASSVFGEPAYYRDGHHSDMRIKDGLMKEDPLFADYVVSALKEFDGMKTSEVMEKAIDDALACDFRATLSEGRKHIL